MHYYLEFKHIYTELENKKEHLIKELAGLPAGTLYCRANNDSNCYYERIPARGNVKKEKRFGVKKDRDRLYKLVRKEYVTNAISLIDKDLKVIESLLRRYRPTDENSVMEDFTAKHPELTEGIYYGQMSYEKWSKSFIPQNDFHKDSLKSIAAGGGKRRSLGELVIGSRLDYYGIPYRYEAPIGHPDIPYIPDYTIIRPRDSKIIYWEHLGKVNDREYMENNKRKFEVYENYGIVPWDNLIVSYSQADYGLNEKLIDALINGWLL